tara:strand:+ start:980 stop:2143 length:1164 start_codon:yes stop_codon:yes gene_type:complete
MSGKGIENEVSIKLEDEQKWISFGASGSSPATLQDSDVWTVSFWIGNYDGDTNDTFMGKIGSTELIKLSSSGVSDNITFVDSGGNEASFEDNDFLDDGSWHHLVFSSDGTNITYFRNGVRVSQITPTANTDFKIQQVGLVYMVNDSFFQHTQCDLSELAIWERGLTDSECIGLYNGGDPVNIAEDYPLLLKAWYRMGDGQSLVKPIPSELVVGGDMESGTNWQQYGSSNDFGLSTDQYKTGAKSYKWSGGGSASGGIETHDDNDFNLIAGTYYFVSAHMYITQVHTSGAGYDYYLGINDGTSTLTNTGHTQNAVAANAWDYYSLITKANYTTSSGKVVIHNANNVSVGAVLYADDVKCVQAKQLRDFSGKGNHAYIAGNITFGRHGE